MKPSPNSGYGNVQLVTGAVRRLVSATFDQVRAAIGGDPEDVRVMLEAAVEAGTVRKVGERFQATR